MWKTTTSFTKAKLPIQWTSAEPPYKDSWLPSDNHRLLSVSLPTSTWRVYPTVLLLGSYFRTSFLHHANASSPAGSLASKAARPDVSHADVLSITDVTEVWKSGSVRGANIARLWCLCVSPSLETWNWRGRPPTTNRFADVVETFSLSLSLSLLLFWFVSLCVFFSNVHDYWFCTVCYCWYCVPVKSGSLVACL